MEKIKDWITVENGNHVPIREGQTKEQAIASHFMQNNGSLRGYSQAEKRNELARLYTNGEETISLPDEQLPRSLSARWANEDIKMPDGTIAHFVEGSKLQNKQAFAGAGTKKPIRDIERLVNKYGGEEKNWQKMKANAKILHKGEELSVEVHWYEEPSIGKKEIKFKKYI